MKESSPRLALVDALRGVASLGVLLAHLVTNEVSKDTLSRVLPTFLREFCFQGNFGVQVFFVLSGFVIALSLSQKPLTWPQAANFILRRQIRLDLPYFVAMAGLVWLHAAFGRGWPDFKTVALNLVYVHNLVGAPQLLGVAWTLCLEIQFYAAFLVVLALGRWLGKSCESPVSILSVHLVWISALVSCFLVQIGTPPQLYALGSHSWFYFAAGALCFWAWRGQAPLWMLGIVVFGMNLSALWAFFAREASFVSASFEGIETAVVTTLLLFIGAQRGWIETLSLGKIGQGLGRISYSLYLTHAFSIEGVMWLTRAIWGATSRGALIGFVLALPLSILAAWTFYLAVEAPSLRLAARFKRA
ncbi:MAG TPA: acyltransferase [Abditibacterium sp.]|jgi:peptidoglycan/LPS O-acetylase OafA/YrhL